MSKKRDRYQEEEIEKSEPEDSRNTVQNKRPEARWQTFEQCWNACVKNGTPLLMESCKAHLKAMGWLNKPEKFIDGIRHFGVEVEK